MTRLQEVRFILWSVLFLNFLVALMKLGYGLWTHSLGMQADGFHSLFDGVSNVVGLTGLWLAAAPPDYNHPYGHKKFETLAAAGIGGMLVSTCLYLIWRSYQSWAGTTVPIVTGISFAVMGMTMVINYGTTKWEMQKGKQLHSEILIADSYHTASDLLTSLSVLLGLVVMKLGYPQIDPIITLIVAGVIAWTAFTIFREAVSSFTDTIRLDPDEVRAVILETPGVVDGHHIRTRGLPHHIFMDLSIHVQPDLSIEAAHAIAHRVEESLKVHFQSIEDVVVHIEPAEHGDDLK